MLTSSDRLFWREGGWEGEGGRKGWRESERKRDRTREKEHSKVCCVLQTWRVRFALCSVAGCRPSRSARRRCSRFFGSCPMACLAECKQV